MTIGEFLDEACCIEESGDVREAERFIAREASRVKDAQGCTWPEARRIVLGNIAYGAGYFSAETRVRLRKFFLEESEWGKPLDTRA